MSSSADFVMHLTAQGLSLSSQKHPNYGSIHVDFVKGKLGFRLKKSQHQKELIVRAIGLHKGLPLTVLDATAGLGRDAFIMASQGAQVVMLERSAIIVALLQDGLLRARARAELIPILDRMTLILANAVEYLSQKEKSYDVIYLDPMFPQRTKAALVKKEMQIMQGLLGEDKDSKQLFELALKKAKQRVVVKRPRLAPPLSDKVPSFALIGRSCRFDIYSQ